MADVDHLTSYRTCRTQDLAAVPPFGERRLSRGVRSLIVPIPAHVDFVLDELEVLLDLLVDSRRSALGDFRLPAILRLRVLGHGLVAIVEVLIGFDRRLAILQLSRVLLFELPSPSTFARILILDPDWLALWWPLHGSCLLSLSIHLLIHAVVVGVVEILLVLWLLGYCLLRVDQVGLWSRLLLQGHEISDH